VTGFKSQSGSAVSPTIASTLLVSVELSHFILKPLDPVTVIRAGEAHKAKLYFVLYCIYPFL